MDEPRDTIAAIATATGVGDEAGIDGPGEPRDTIATATGVGDEAGIDGPGEPRDTIATATGVGDEGGIAGPGEPRDTIAAIATATGVGDEGGIAGPDEPRDTIAAIATATGVGDEGGIDGPGEPRDTIAAIATATGVGGVGIVRVSGPAALAVAAAVTGRAVEAWAERRLVRVGVRGADGGRIDDGLGVAMRGPASFTGDDVIELHVHGGAVNLGAVLGAVLAAGARAAEPGEFTRRALAAGKIGLLEAEAMLAVVHAESARGWGLAQAHLAGGLASTVATLRADAAGVLAEVEAGIDFPEEDVSPAGRGELVRRTSALAEACGRLAGSFGAGRALTDGLTVALVGRVNAGKSSLLNALAGSERALVSAEPGTTRDWLEARVVWRGVAVTLVDTAGLRDAGDELERRGIELGRRRTTDAHVVVRVVAPEDPEPDDVDDLRTIRVASKADLSAARSGYLATSAVTGAGIEALRAEVLARCGVVDDVEAGGAVVLTERQRAAASTAARGFIAAVGAIERGLPSEIVALELRAGADALAQLAGERVGEAVLDQLFARFCIGK